MGRGACNRFRCPWRLFIISELEERQKRFDEIKERVHRTSIYISTNLREEDKTRFKKLADSKFNGDYAFALMWLLDMSEGFFTNPDEEIVAKIDILADEINKINETLAQLQAKPKEEIRKIKMADGSVKRRGAI